MAKNNNNNKVSGETKIKRHVIDTVNIYDITESELNELERGSQADLFLEFAIFFLSSGLACFIALMTASFETVINIYFTCAAYLGFAIGLVLGCLWIRGRRNRKSIIQKIRKRGESDEERHYYMVFNSDGTFEKKLE